MRIRHRGYCVTINNYTDDDIVAFDSIKATYKVRGFEVSSTGTPHIQGYLYFKNLLEFKTLSKWLPRAHIEPAKGSAKENRNYCIKEGDFKEFGDVPAQGKRNDLVRVIELLKEQGLSAVAEHYPIPFVRFSRGLRDLALHLTKPFIPSGLRGLWIFGPPGVGKSRRVFEAFPHAYRKSQNKWFDSYDAQKVIVLDDFDKQGTVLSHHLKIWSDRYPCIGETKGGTVHLRHDLFIITSNYSPKELWPEDPVLCQAIRRRFQIIRFLPMSYASKLTNLPTYIDEDDYDRIVDDHSIIDILKQETRVD